MVRPDPSARPAPAVSRAPTVMRWARTGPQTTWQEWIEDCLAGLLWYGGVFLVLGVVAVIVRALAG